MTTIESALVLALDAPDFDSFAVRQAMAGFLAGFGESTRDAYSLDLRRWMRWCVSHDLGIFVGRVVASPAGRFPSGRLPLDLQVEALHLGHGRVELGFLTV